MLRGMSTAAEVPETRGELEGDEALETLRATGRVRLLRDSFLRFRAADGFSHSRALAFQLTLALVPAVIAVVGLAAALEQGTFRRVVEETLRAIAPGAAGDLLTQALRQGTAAAQESGETALVVGGLAALVAGATAMAQVERGANRIYGTERDRPFARKYAVGLALAATAGLLSLAALAVLVGGSAIRRAAGWSGTVDDVWVIGRWPLGVALVIAAISILFELSPRRAQPEASWLAFGAAVSALLWLAFMGVLVVAIDVSNQFGATYGPLAGTIGILLWALGTAVSLFAGLAFAAQLEAVRAGTPTPRVERHSNRPDSRPTESANVGAR
jgi:YihY family inner membrane protein